MKTATIRDVQHNLAEILSWVERGEEVRVMRRRKVVARLLPAEPVPPPPPNFVGRARKVWGAKPRGAALSAIVAEDRDDR